MDQNFLPTGEQIDAIIELVYQVVLNREADPAGLEFYRRNIQEGIRTNRYTNGLDIVNALGRSIESSSEFQTRFPGSYADFGQLNQRYLAFVEEIVVESTVDQMLQDQTNVDVGFDTKSIDEQIADAMSTAQKSLQPYFDEYDALVGRQVSEGRQGVEESYALQKQMIESSRKRGLRDVGLENITAVSDTSEALGARGLSDTGLARKRFGRVQQSTDLAVEDIQTGATEALLRADQQRQQALRDIETQAAFKRLSSKMALQGAVVGAAT